MLGTVNGEPVMPGAGLLKRSQLDVLIQTLRARGYRVVGPRVRGGAIVYDEISRAEELPAGLISVQDKTFLTRTPYPDEDMQRMCMALQDVVNECRVR